MPHKPANSNVGQVKDKQWWALKGPDGSIYDETIGRSKADCWGEAFCMLATKFGPEWERRYWKRLSASVNNGRKHGYTFVRIMFVEVASKKKAIDIGDYFWSCGRAANSFSQRAE